MQKIVTATYKSNDAGLLFEQEISSYTKYYLVEEENVKDFVQKLYFDQDNKIKSNKDFIDDSFEKEDFQGKITLQWQLDDDYNKKNEGNIYDFFHVSILDITPTPIFK